MKGSTLVAVVCVAACAAVAMADVDLGLNVPMLRKTLKIRYKKFGRRSCALEERCVGGTGRRKLLKFATGIINHGSDDYYIGRPRDNIDGTFEWSQCHRHWHHNGIADYTLLDKDNDRVIVGHKQSFCMEDTQPYSARGRGKYSCRNQGISSGFQDVYKSYLDCQWLDITDVPDGVYTLRIKLLPDNHIASLVDDSNPNNNAAKAKIQIRGKKVKVLSAKLV